jgi:DNA polymerase-3 subunit epsilon
LLGYYLEYDVAMINKFLQPMLGIKLPQQADRSVQPVCPAKKQNTIIHDTPMSTCAWPVSLKSYSIPDLPRHDALNDAINVAMMLLALEARKRRR